MTSTLHPFKKAFPVTRDCIYFNHAATAPYSSLTAGAMEGYIRDMLQCGGKNYATWNKVREETRELGARLINSRTDEIALISNTSEGANIVAQGLSIQTGDNIVLPAKEFPANYYPWANLKRKGVEIRIVPLNQGSVLVDDILARVDERTRTVAVSSVAYHNGSRLDLETLGAALEARAVPLYVDAIQSLGVLPMDVKQCKVSFLAADGHKWLLAPEGAALFFCATDHLSTLNQAYASWLSVQEPFQFDNLSQGPADGARRFECGSSNLAGIVGLHQSLKMLLEIGVENIMEEVLSLTDRAMEGLIEKGYRLLTPRERAARSGIVTFAHPVHTLEFLAQILNDTGVVFTLRGGGVRISPHFYNTPAEVVKFLEALP